MPDLLRWQKNMYSEAFELDGDLTRYFNQLSYAEFILGNYEKSIKLFEKINEQNNWSVYLDLGISHSYSGQNTELLKYFKKYVEKLDRIQHA